MRPTYMRVRARPPEPACLPTDEEVMNGVLPDYAPSCSVSLIIAAARI